MILCPVCGQPMHEYEQPSCLPERPSYPLAECQQADCDYRYVTLSPQAHAGMSQEQREKYLKVNRRRVRRLQQEQVS